MKPGRFLWVLGGWMRVPRIIYNSKFVTAVGYRLIDCGSHYLQLNRQIPGHEVSILYRTSAIPK